MHSLPGANANDDKVFAPQYCKGEDWTTQEDIYYSDHAMLTQQGGDEWGFCPLMRDSAQGNLDDLWIRLHSESYTQDGTPTCCVSSMSPTGAFEDSECEGVTHLGFSSLHYALDDFTEYDYGSYGIICTMNQGDMIFSIRTSES